MGATAPRKIASTFALRRQISDVVTEVRRRRFSSLSCGGVATTAGWRFFFLCSDLHSRGELKLTSGNDALAGFHAIDDHGRLAVLSLAGLYLTQIERRVGFHDKNVWSVLSDLHGAARHQHRIFERLQNQPHANRSEERRVGKECKNRMARE